MTLGCLRLKASDPQDVANTYKNAIQARSTKVAEALGRLEATPVSERTPNVTSCPAL